MDSLVAENLGKCYILQGSGVKRQTSTFRERLQPWKNADGEQSEAREFWALRDVSFRLQPGSILGIIGANGVGKTTLLKILARVITPTTGRVVGIGRVVSLLELGAGFDPDLPANENILMNAAILRIPRAGRRSAAPRTWSSSRRSSSLAAARCAITRAACICASRSRSRST